jgi:hypothetical protein
MYPTRTQQKYTQLEMLIDLHVVLSYSLCNLLSAQFIGDKKSFNAAFCNVLHTDRSAKQ